MGFAAEGSCLSSVLGISDSAGSENEGGQYAGGNVMWKKILFFLLILGGVIWWLHDPEVMYGPGRIAPNPPRQLKLRDSGESFHKGKYVLTPRAEYELEARVLHQKRYRFSRGAGLIPLDLALGWGPMSDETNLSRIKISQAMRLYLWHTKQFPIPRREIETHSANTHIIPAGPEIWREMKRIHSGDIVFLKGKLVDAAINDGWSWKTSLSRTDTGAGACELVYVETFINRTPSRQTAAE